MFNDARARVHAELESIPIACQAYRLPVQLGFDIGKVAPEFCVTVHAPHLILSNLDDYLQRMQVAVTQFAARNMVPSARASVAGVG